MGRTERRTWIPTDPIEISDSSRIYYYFPSCPSISNRAVGGHCIGPSQETMTREGNKRSTAKINLRRLAFSFDSQEASMFALVRIDVAGRIFPPPKALAVQTEPPSETGLIVDQSWYGSDDSFYAVLSDVTSPVGLSQLAALAVNGSPLGLGEIVRLDADVELADQDRVVIGRTRQDVMGSIPPDYATCPHCRRDLSIQDHQRPPCPRR